MDKMQDNLLPWYAQKITRWIEEEGQHFPDKFYLYGSIELGVRYMEILLKHASSFSPGVSIDHEWHEPPPAHPVSVHFNEKIAFLVEKVCFFYKSLSIGNAGLQRDI